MGKIKLTFQIKIISIIFLFIVFVNHELLAEKRYRIVVFPFKDNTHMEIGEMVSDVLRSTLSQTEYFEAVDRDKVYKTVFTVILGDQIKIDDTERAEGAYTSEEIDLLAQLDMRKVQKFSKKLNADYAVRGSASRIADTLRLDAEINHVKTKKTLGFVSVEGNPDELLTSILNELTTKITMLCKNINAYDDALKIFGMYSQGQYTFAVTEKKLKEMLLIAENPVGIHAVLMALYLSEVHSTESALLEDKIIEEGERVLYQLNEDYNEEALEFFLTSGFDPFHEIAKIYSRRGNNEKAIEMYQSAINVYPINIAGHYKEMGMLYYLSLGLEDKAIQAFEKSLEVDKGDYELHFILASIFEKNRFFDKARKHLEECLRCARNVEEIEAAKGKIDKLTP